jgi:hypothetical protein
VLVSNEAQDDQAEAMADADEANGEGRDDEAGANDTERRYGSDESPA